MKQKSQLSKVLNQTVFTVSNNTDKVDIENEYKEADFETAISATGFGKFNLMLLIIAVPSGWASMFDTTTMSYVLPAAHCDLDINLEQKGLLNGITYLGMITSAFIWGYLADTLGRKKLLVAGYLLDSLFVIMAGLSQNFYMILVAKYMAGFIINGPFAALTSDISEFHCAKYRTRVAMGMGSIYSLANLVLPFVGWAILPKNLDVELLDGTFKLHSWNFFLLVCAIPSLISTFAHLFLPESPKFLMTVGRNDEALRVFKKVYSCNTGKHPDTYPVKSLVDETKLHVAGKHGGVVTANRTKIEALREGWQQIAPLFFPPHILKLVLICTIQCGFMLGANTLRLWLPQIFTTISDYQLLYPNEQASLCQMLDIITPGNNATNGECITNPINDSVYINVIIVASTAIVGYSLIGIFINRVGKKRVLVISGLISGSCGLSIYFAKNTPTTVALSSIMSVLTGICVNVILSVVVDLFPTSLRTMTVSMTMMIGRSGAMMGNLVFPLLLEIGCLPPFFMIGFVTISCALLTTLLPKTDLKSLE